MDEYDIRDVEDRIDELSDQLNDLREVNDRYARFIVYAKCGMGIMASQQLEAEDWDHIRMTQELMEGRGEL